MAGRAGTGLVIESTGNNAGCERPVGLPGGCSEGSWM